MTHAQPRRASPPGIPHTAKAALLFLAGVAALYGAGTLDSLLLVGVALLCGVWGVALHLRDDYTGDQQ